MKFNLENSLKRNDCDMDVKEKVCQLRKIQQKASDVRAIYFY